jgi:DNA-binding CsgD family transcriptional regulator
LSEKKAITMAAPFTRSIICPVFIGRGLYIDALVQLIEQACSGHGQTVLIAGEAGIGKTRLVAEALATLRSSRSQDRTPMVLQGRCFELDRSLPYAPLLDLLRSFLASHSPNDLAAALDPTASALVKLLPELADLLPGPAPGSMLEPEQEKLQLFQALTRFFTRLSVGQPLLVVVEDVHWSDDTSLEFLLYLARRVASQRVLLLLTYRSEEEHPVLTPFLAALDHERLAVELTLTPLTIDQVDEMIRSIFWQPGAMGADSVEAIYRLTEGNPFFVEELLKSLVTSGEIVYTDGKWERKLGKEDQAVLLPDRLQLPRSVQLAVQQRLDHVSTEARELLSLAAVAGRRFDFALLQQLTQRNEAELLRLIKELITAQLVIEEVEDVFTFRHALTRQAVYSDLLGRERKTLHRSIAEATERLYADALDAHLDDLAYHFYAAGAWAKVLEYAQHAGEKAQRLYAPRTALEHYTHALDSAHQLSMSPPPALYHARAQAYETLGAFDHARTDYEQVLNAARSAPDPILELKGLLDLGALWRARNYARAGEYFQQATELARTLGDTSILGHTLNQLGNWHVHLEELSEGRRYYLEALDIFLSFSDRRSMAETLDLLGTCSFNMGGSQIEAGTRYYTQAIALWRALEVRQGLVYSLGMVGLRGPNYLNALTAWQAPGAECVRDLEEALMNARRMGWRAGQAYALVSLACCLGPQGEYTRAWKCAQASMDIATEIEHGTWMTYAHLLLGILSFDLLALPAARQHLEQALACAQEIRSLFWLRVSSAFLASVAIAQREFARAEEALTLAPGLDAACPTHSQRLLWRAQVQLTLARGDPARALQVIDRLIASLSDREQHDGGIAPHLMHLRAETLVALNRTEEAETLLQAAQATARSQGARPILWRIYVTLARLYQGQARRSEAEEFFSTARRVIEDLASSVPDEAMRDNFLQRASAQIPPAPMLSPRRTARQSFGGLTEREREVAALVAQGKSNRSLADELVVSERTIAKHVENILSKLGFSSRAQIAAWAVEKGLTKTTK